MITKYMKTLAVFLLAASLTSPVLGQDDAKTLDQLLEMIESSAISESTESRKREADFKSDQRKQAQALKSAQNTKVSEEKRSDRLEKKIKDNDIQIAKLREQRDKRLGSLKELFGHLTGAAGDIRANIDQSIVSAQISGRTESLDDLIAKMLSLIHI